MFATIKRIAFVVMILSAMASLFITLGTLNGRLPGGLTVHNTPWLIAVSVFAGSIVLSLVLKVLSPLIDAPRALN